MLVAEDVHDEHLNGWWKALWIVFLVFVPFLTALVYLIARGPGMARRGRRAVDRERSEADSYIRSVAGRSPAEEIDRAAQLRAAGTISDEEFARLKERALA